VTVMECERARAGKSRPPKRAADGGECVAKQHRISLVQKWRPLQPGRPAHTPAQDGLQGAHATMYEASHWFTILPHTHAQEERCAVLCVPDQGSTPRSSESKGRRFTFGPDRQRFRNAQFRLLMGCKARHVHAYNNPWSSTPQMPIMEARRQRERKKYRKTGTLHFLHAR